MKLFKIISVILLFLLGLGFLSCNKGKFLDEKPSTDLFVPTTLEDFQKILDNDVVMSETPELGELSADNFYVTNSFWQGRLTIKEHNAYVWAPDIFQGQGNVDDWNIPYQQVFYANVVLEGLGKVAVTSTNAVQWNNIKGIALFIRSYAFYNIAQVFASVYDNSYANQKNLGIPLRLKPETDEVSVRSTLKDTYGQIISDLMQAKDLLPQSIDTSHLNRPSRPAALGMLARVFLSMRDYKNANIYADSSLQMYSLLYDYNAFSSQVPVLPFFKNNPETIYQSHILSSTFIMKGGPGSNCIVDSTLYRSYQPNDLRLSVFIMNNSAGKVPRGGYNGTVYMFSGLATDELYLIRAESLARLGNPDAAISDLNTLLVKRYKTGFFVPFVAAAIPDVDSLVLEERRKELPFRGVRWTDLRRLNKDGAGILIIRKLNGVSDTLAPNSNYWVLPIPPDVIQLTGMQQNPR